MLIGILMRQYFDCFGLRNPDILQLQTGFVVDVCRNFEFSFMITIFVFVFLHDEFALMEFNSQCGCNAWYKELLFRMCIDNDEITIFS
jgi:hypothetical protein